MFSKTKLPNKVLNVILEEYNLGKLVNSKIFTSGSVQKNIFIETNKGKFVLRIYKNNSKNNILFEINLLKYLKKHNYPCPGLIENKKGKYIGTYEKQNYVIFEFIEGTHIEKPNEKQKKQLTKKVAELQNILKNYKPLEIKYRWNYNIEFCLKMAQKKAKEIGTPEAKKKLTWYKHELQKLELLETLPMSICHCDFHFSNVIFKNGKFKALIDFDDANFTYSIFDLACLIEPFTSSFDWNSWKKFKKDSYVFDFKNTKNTVKEYQKHRPLKTSEKKHLFDVFKLTVFIDCLWYFKRGKAEDFFEKRKIEYLDKLGRDKFYNEIFK